jgi:hypothetical protein
MTYPSSSTKEAIKLYGFAILRNGVKYDYPFRESLLSLSPLVQTLFLALGDSEDDTQSYLKDIPNLKIIPTIWDEKLRKGALILSQQTNLILDSLRQHIPPHEQHLSWGLYIQCDEVLHEDQYNLILSDLQKAHELHHDSVSFRYIHFWKHHHQMAINKKWYPQEIRAIKLFSGNSPIESWGDAQSFRGHHKPYDSEAIFYHYGHVRKQDSYQHKKEDILKLYHQDHLLKKYQKREKRLDQKTETLSFLGLHPLVMKERIELLEGKTSWEYPSQQSLVVVDPLQEISSDILKKIHVQEIFVVQHLTQLPPQVKKQKKLTIFVHPSFFQRIFNKDFTPHKMKSPLARRWSQEFIFSLKLFSKKIGLSRSASPNISFCSNPFLLKNK